MHREEVCGEGDEDAAVLFAERVSVRGRWRGGGSGGLEDVADHAEAAGWRYSEGHAIGVEYVETIDMFL